MRDMSYLNDERLRLLRMSDDVNITHAHAILSDQIDETCLIDDDDAIERRETRAKLSCMLIFESEICLNV